MNAIKTIAGIVLALTCAATFAGGCAAPSTTPSSGTATSQQAEVAQQIANLRQMLLEANGITQVLAATGVITPAEQAIGNGLYASAVAGLTEATAENAAGQSINVINVTLAGVNGYLQQISQVHNAGRVRAKGGVSA
jgi:hypothetical protein